MTKNLHNLAQRLIEKTKTFGATDVEVLISTSADQSLEVRHGKVEGTERSENQHLGIRAFIGQKLANVSTSDFSDSVFDILCERVVDMAKNSPENPFAGLAKESELCKNFPELDLVDSYLPSTDELFEKAFTAEQAGLAVSGITNSEGGNAACGIYNTILATSNGFVGGYEKTVFSVSCSLLAGTDTGMERDYDYSVKTHWSDLEGSEILGKRAADRAIARLNPRKIPSGKYPIIFDRRIASSLLSHFSDAICGTSIARKTSFLLDSLGKEIFNPLITILDDPHRLRSLGSSPFDGEGLDNKVLTLIDKGVLNHYLLDCATAKQLQMTNTARSKRGTGSPSTPSTTNLHLQAGTQSREDMIKNIKQGLLVTDLIGFGVNDVTGDYSRGASGFWIENGEVTYPVSEITIAGNLKDMYKTLIPASDLEFKSRTNSPSVFIDGLTVAGA